MIKIQAKTGFTQPEGRDFYASGNSEDGVSVLHKSLQIKANIPTACAIKILFPGQKRHTNAVNTH